MDFLILGPIEVHDASGAVALGGSKPRAVLAVLLLHANRPVSAERLALALWGEDAPGGAVKTVQVHVSRLRKALGDADVIATTAAGYCLRVRDGELDAARFERLVEDARRALAAGQPADASAILRKAVALWRGQALADLAMEPFARAESTRLEEQRLAAIELRVEADLAAGRHAEVVGELAQLVAGHPTREQLSGQLMLALYRCGRQREALEAYAAVRRVLVEDMGIEPGPELRELHAAILRQDVALQADTTIGELPPALDPAASQPLVGRDDELAWLLARSDSARTGAGGVVALIGPRGAGKSRLTQELARAVHAEGVAVMHASGAGPADTILVALSRVRAATRPLLLVLDDIDRAGAGVRTELADLALESAPALVVACAPDRLALTHVALQDTLELVALDAEAVRAIAARYAPARAVEEVPAEWLLDASGGVARRVHEVASQWARREAAAHVGAVADRAVAGRAELRSIEAELTGGVVDLQETRERGAPRDDDAAPVVCPFKGLASYDVADARYFFGRERLVAELVARLVGAPLLGVVGPSGSGKSSVLRAGLLPALAGGVLPGSEDWAQALLRPGAHPMRELGAALAEAPAGGRVVLAVDQFEEAFTVCDDEAERAEFISELVHAANGAGGRYLVVLALRADHYGRCAAYPELARLLAASNVLVHPMLHDELLRAIERPAQVAGLRIEPELADALVDDVEREPGGLPLLSTALLELWQHRDGRRLRHAVYVQMGGVHGAVARLAEAAYGELDAGQRAIARRVLMRMVVAGDGDAVERRRVALAELETERDEDLARVVALLTDRRLLTVSAGTVELAHEALLREWPRLHGWIEEDREGLRIGRSLGAAAREWDELGREDGALYRGARLRTAVEWREATDPALDELERAFLAASVASRDHDRATRRRRSGLVLGAVATVVVAIVAVAVAAVFAGRASDVAASRDLATQASALSSVDPALGLAIAREALDRSDTAQARAALRQEALDDRLTASVQAHDGKAWVSDPSPDGKHVVTAGDDGRVRVWTRDGLRGGRVIVKQRGAVYSAAYTPDGKTIASVSDDGAVTLTPSAGGPSRPLRRLTGEQGYGYSVDAAGDVLVVGTSTGRIWIYPTAPGAQPRLLGRHPSGKAALVAINDDATAVVSGDANGDGTGDGYLWDVETGDSQKLAVHGSVGGVAFSRDGAHVAAALDDGRRGLVEEWDASTAKPTGPPLQVSGQATYSVRYGAGRRVVTAGGDGVVRTADLADRQVIGAMPGTSALYADFVPRSDAIVSVGGDGMLRAWDPLAVKTTRARGTIPFFSTKGDHVVSGSEHGAVHVWDLAHGVRSYAGDSDGDASVTAFSADGSQVVSAAGDKSVRLIDVDGGAPRELRFPRFPRTAVAMSARGQIAVAGDNAAIVIQNRDGSHHVELTGYDASINALAFSRDGRLLVSASEDGTAAIWDPSRSASRPKRIIHADSKAVRSVAFSDDKRYVATGGFDGIIRIWPLAGGAPVVLVGHVGPVNSAEFNHRGDRIVSAGVDGFVRVWDSAGGGALVVLVRHAGNASGADFSPNGRDVVSAGDDGMRITSCEVCGSFSEAQRVAGTRAPRRLSASERQRFADDS